MVKKTSRETILYWDIKACIENNPMSLRQLADKLRLDYQLVILEIENLRKLGKIVNVRHAGKMMLLWTDMVPKFEYELSNNILELRKVSRQFIGTVNDTNQFVIPMSIIKALDEKVKLTTRINLMLEIKALQVNNIWYKINQEQEK